MSNKPKSKPRAVKAVLPPPEEAPAEAPAAEQQQVRGVKPASVINALNEALNERAQQMRNLEDRIVMLTAVIAEQDEELAALKKRVPRRKG